ncbi:MAG: transposase [Proteobacteria bacterium]|nr:transposase [Pseudomonadota bacterium]
MPRNARILLNDYPHHIIQRGHNRQAVFASDGDYLLYLDNLQEWKEKCGCKVYAYCLMTNHVHLIIDPGSDGHNLAMLMKRVAGRQTRYVNKIEKRSGTLWEGRYKSSPISTNEYLLACCRYVELNPVRASMVAAPEAYRWSSYRAKVGMTKQAWLDFDQHYLDLASTAKKRQRKYKDYFLGTISDEEMELIRGAIQRGQLTGTNQFIEEIEAKVGKRIEFRGQGRPRKAGD